MGFYYDRIDEKWVPLDHDRKLKLTVNECAACHTPSANAAPSSPRWGHRRGSTTRWPMCPALPETP